jgi:hypothetical protein
MNQAKWLQVRTIDTDPSWKVSSVEYKPNKYWVKTAMIVDTEYRYREWETYRNPIVISGDITMLDSLPQRYYGDYYTNRSAWGTIRPEMNTLLKLKDTYHNYPERFAQKALQILSQDQDIMNIWMGMRQAELWDSIFPFPSSIAMRKKGMPLEISAIPNYFDSFNTALSYGWFRAIMENGEEIHEAWKSPIQAFWAWLRWESPRREFVDRERINPESLMIAFKDFQSKKPLGIHGDSPERQIHINTELVKKTNLFALAGRWENGSLFLTVADLEECVKHWVYLSLEGPSLKCR